VKHQSLWLTDCVGAPDRRTANVIMHHVSSSSALPAGPPLILYEGKFECNGEIKPCLILFEDSDGGSPIIPGEGSDAIPNTRIGERSSVQRTRESRSDPM
jgi:hypothetical protein